MSWENYGNSLFMLAGFSFLLYVQECSHFIFLTHSFLFPFLGELHTSYVVDTFRSCCTYLLHSHFFHIICLSVPWWVSGWVGGLIVLFDDFYSGVFKNVCFCNVFKCIWAG